MIIEQSSLALCALLSVGVSWTRSPFMSLMYAVLLFVNTSILMLTLGYEFLALVNLLVYVGALAVLFLFVIMLLEIPATELRAYARGWSTLALTALICIYIVKIWAAYARGPLSTGIMEEIHSTIPPIGSTPAMESISRIGEALYVHYSDVLVLNSMVLTIALIGALVLAHSRSA